MSKLFYLFIFTIIIINESLSAEIINKNNSCSWDNRNNFPCLEINSKIPNSSRFSMSGINKIVITKKQINESGAIDLIDVLRTIPDIKITQSGPRGQQASLFMRGAGSNHTLVLINGVPINDQSTTQGLHDFGVDFIQTVQQIEVYPGSSATHFGTNAIGGAINIVLTGDFKNYISYSGDKNKNYEFLSNKTLIFNNSSSLNFKFGTVRNETVSAMGNYNDEKDEMINYSSNFNYENWISNNLKIFNTAYLRQTKAEYDDSSAEQHGYEGTNNMGSYQIGMENSNQNQKNSLVYYYNVYDRKYDERGVIDKYKSNTTGIKYNLSKLINNNVSYGLGLEYKYDWGYFDNNGSYKASTKGNSDNFALYGNLGWNLLNNSNISLFYRNDNHKQTDNNNTYKLNFDQKFNNFNIGLTHMNSLRNPTLYEFFGTDSNGYSGNRSLNPEKSNTNEIYSNLKIRDNIQISLRAFKSNIKNNIEYVNNKYVNDSDNIDLNQSGINSEIYYKNNSSYVKFYSSFLSSKKESGSDQLRRPKKNYGLSFSKKNTNKLFGDYSFFILYDHYGKHFDTHSSNFNTIEMDGTNIVDLIFTKRINNSDLYLKITNLFNETFQKPHGYNQEKRIIKIGLKY